MKFLPVDFKMLQKLCCGTKATLRILPSCRTSLVSHIIDQTWKPDPTGFFHLDSFSPDDRAHSRLRFYLTNGGGAK
ncbi:hypothetical protein M514_20281 [Trichuris suis]|uniref:Uncharacterized protein n=1 Tax=Trichuris suis TaxID=68888 RepID=A0A085NDQ8_9BILA|nr:hypothetical protein M514_20281 [Trichuris suis]